MPTAVTACPHRTYFARPRWTRDITERRASTVLSMSTGEGPSARQVLGTLGVCGVGRPLLQPIVNTSRTAPGRAHHPRRSGLRGQCAVVFVGADHVYPPLVSRDARERGGEERRHHRLGLLDGVHPAADR